MNRVLIIWNVVLTILCGYLFYKSSPSTVASSPFGNSQSNGSGNFRMAYFEMDSIAANFEMVKELKAEMTKREDAIDAELESLSKNMQNRLIYYQQQEATLTDDQKEAANRDLRTMEDNLKSRKQSLESDYSDFVLRRQNEVKNQIEQVLQDYNKTSQFSYIVSYEPGLFYYKDSAYNITRDLINGLNGRYKTQKK